MKLIDLYKEWAKAGNISRPDRLDNGLCELIPGEYDQSWRLFKPDQGEKQALLDDGFCSAYWASGLPKDHPDECSAFSPLRQTIVLLICAMNNEL